MYWVKNHEAVSGLFKEFTLNPIDTQQISIKDGKILIKDDFIRIVGDGEEIKFTSCFDADREYKFFDKLFKQSKNYTIRWFECLYENNSEEILRNATYKELKCNLDIKLGKIFNSKNKPIGVIIDGRDSNKYASKIKIIDQNIIHSDKLIVDMFVE